MLQEVLTQHLLCCSELPNLGLTVRITQNSLNTDIGETQQKYPTEKGGDFRLHSAVCSAYAGAGC